RFNPDGSLDPTFDGDGQLVLHVGPEPDSAFVQGDTASAVAVQPDGKILVAGRLTRGAVVLVRLNADGSLDGTFGQGGLVTQDALPPLITNVEFGDVLVQPDGKILLSTKASSGKPVVRLNANGSVDGVFQGAPFWDARALALQPDGRVLLGGLDMLGPGNFPVDRFTPDGRPDLTWGGDGRTSVLRPLAAGGQQAIADGFALQPDGRVVAVGVLEPYGLQERNGGLF